MPVTWLWSTSVTGRHEKVAWHAPHEVLDRMWVALFPVARVPSWQLTHDSVTPLCEKFAGRHWIVVWQRSQPLSDGI